MPPPADEPAVAKREDDAEMMPLDDDGDGDDNTCISGFDLWSVLE